MVDLFLGRNLPPKRIRLTPKIVEEEESVLVNLIGDVMMIDWNIVDDRPKKRDTMRRDLLFGELLDQINNVKSLENET